MPVNWIDYIYGCNISKDELSKAYLMLSKCEKCTSEAPCEGCNGETHDNLNDLWLSMKYQERDWDRVKDPLGDVYFKDLQGIVKTYPMLPKRFVIRQFPDCYYPNNDFVIGVLINDNPDESGKSHDGSFIKIRDETDVKIIFETYKDQVPILKGMQPKTFFVPEDI